MRDFEKQNLRLNKLPFLGKVVYTVFLFFTLIGVAATIALYHDMVGLSGRRIATYYRGSTANSQHLRAGSSNHNALGPELQLPSEAIIYTEEAMPMRKLLEVSHFHLFSMPIYLLILSHLFMMTGFSERSRVVWIALSSISTLLHMIAPWVARTGVHGASMFYASSGALLALSYTVMAVGTLLGLWMTRGLRT